MKFGFYSLVCLALSMAIPSVFGQSSRRLEAQGAPSSYLGIGVVEITPDRAKALNLKDVRGAEVAHLDDNGPASKAGIKEGDVVLEYNGAPVDGVEQLVRMVRETPVGRQVKLTLWRNGGAQTLTVAVGERQAAVIQTPGGPVRIPEIPAIPPIDIPRFSLSLQSPLLGIEGESLGQERQFAEYFGVKDGVLVKQVLENTPAEKAGLKAGDVITRVEGNNVSSTRDITAHLRSDRSKRSATLTVVRDKKEMPLVVNLDSGSRNATASGDRF
ncbi:MAG: PDZ domain-containing protein [Acidobacteriia bacterium]|nr:PDZ domain-containing protein [Terriglobia bacterium]